MLTALLALSWKISEGNSPMPSFVEAFTEEQRWQIVNYVRTLASPISPIVVTTTNIVATKTQ